MSWNEILLQKEKRFIAKTQKIPYFPVAFRSGKGALLVDEEGKEYIDFLASASSANLGHGNKAIADAVYEQMQELTQYTLAYFNTKPPLALAEKVAELAPMEGAQVLYSATGSASVDAAIKVARGYTGRTKLISMIESYHGSTYGAISLSALSTNMRRKIGPLLPEMYHFHYPDSQRSAESCLNELRDAFDHYLPPEEVAAIIIEPVAGDAGMVIPPVEWLQGLRDLCDEHGILLICDEIQQGLCRTGTWFALENFGVKADLYILGKSFGGGLPLGAVVGKAEIMAALEPPAHVFTMAGNAAVCAAALKNIELLEEMKANEMAVTKGAYLKQRFEALRHKYPVIGEVRQLGLSIGVDIHPLGEPGAKDYVTTAKVCYRAFELGLIMIFLNQSTLRVQPPLVITEEEMDRAMNIIEEALDDVMAQRVDDQVFKVLQGW